MTDVEFNKSLNTLRRPDVILKIQYRKIIAK